MTNVSADLGFIHRFERGADGAPVLLLLHGTGGDEEDLLPLGRMVLPGAWLLSPRGRVQEHGMNRFFRRFAPTVIDEDDVKLRANELANFVNAAAVQYGFPIGKVMALGYSNGANIAASLLLLRPEVLSSAILLRARVPLTAAPLPDLRGKAVLVSEGDEDVYVTREQAIELDSTLRKAGADVEFLRIAPTHGLDEAEIGPIQRWARSVSAAG